MLKMSENQQNQDQNLDSSKLDDDDQQSVTTSRPASRGEHHSPTLSAQGSQIRTSLRKLTQEKKAKKINFYRNGDRFHKGLLYVLSLEKIRSFDALLEDLTRLLGNHVSLPKGVRYILTIDGKEKISSLDQLHEWESYICSSTDNIVKLNYGKKEKIEKPPQSNSIRKPIENIVIQKSEPSVSYSESGTKDLRSFIHPKLITVIRNGVKPRKTVRMLLNKKTAHSFEQVLVDLTTAIKLDTGAVRKVFTLSGKQVLTNILELSNSDMEDNTMSVIKISKWKYLTGSNKNITKKSKTSTGNVQSPTPSKRSPGSSTHSSQAASPKPSRRLYPSVIMLYMSAKFYENQPLAELEVSFLGLRIPTCITRNDISLSNPNYRVTFYIFRGTKLEYALKIIDKAKCKGKEHMITSEVAILRRVKHPNIVQLLGEFDFGNELYLVMELVKGGDLFDAIATATKYTERDASGMVYNLGSALRYLHSLNIVHRDIKPENLLVMEHEDGSKSLKLGDFGLAVEATEPLYTVCGTPTYVAPEILAETGYGLKVDVWAAGVITYILLCGFPPFFRELITQMLQLHPDRRYSATQVLEHPWVAEDAMAPDYDMHSTVSRKLSMHFDHKRKYCSQYAGVAVITATPLDKEQNYFQAHSRSSQASPRSVSPIVLQRLQLEEEVF
ncbi:serine/threonine-protein kinase DCLK1-like [Centruroides sculpturatus]|uniref:serine/threonine-protein kinase DCLK1-like n=1 Tax=Centruroides sculpturatus TaxID=218467 RepID=UPI000C6DC73B|nr:serine/threonine-protein kinase DCLK1-like [Centruroides sculpturatus]